MRKLLSIFTIFLVISCTSQEKNLPVNFDYGQVEENTYKNSYFDMEVSFDPNWFRPSQEQMNDLANLGTDLLTGDDTNLKSAVKASQVNSAYLLTLFRHEIGAVVDFNPSFLIVAENTRNFPGIKRGSDYLAHTKKLLEQAQIEYSFEKDVYSKNIGDVEFDIMETKMEIMGKSIHQEYISTVINDFTLSFIISYMSEDDKSELYAIVNNIKFKS